LRFRGAGGRCLGRGGGRGEWVVGHVWEGGFLAWEGVCPEFD